MRHYKIKIQLNPAISKSQGKWKKVRNSGFRNNRESVKFVTMNHRLIKYVCNPHQKISEHYFTMSNDQNRDSRVHT